MHCRSCSSRFVVPVSVVSAGAASSMLGGSERCAFSTVRVRRQVGSLFSNRIRGSRRTAPPVVPGAGVRAVAVSVACGSGITSSRVSAFPWSAVPLSTFGLRTQRVNYSLSSHSSAQYLRPMHLGNSQGAASRRAWPNPRFQATADGVLRPPSSSPETHRWA